MSDAVGLLHADKHKSYKSILRSFDGCVQAFLKFPKKTSLQCFRNILKKARDEVDFFDADKYQSFLTVDFNTLGIKFFYNVIGMILKTGRAWWWEWWSILKVLKVTSLQFLYNISKKKLWMEFSIFDVGYRFLMKVARNVQSIQKGSLLNFGNILEKSIVNVFVFYCHAKHSDTLLGFSHVCYYLFLGGCVPKLEWPFRSCNSEIWCISKEWIDKMS